MAEREAATAELLAALPAARRARRPSSCWRAARRYIPLREVGKAAFLQAVDGARAAARVLGEELASEGTIGDPDDVCYLTVDEIFGSLPADTKEVVAFRRAKREEYLEAAAPRHVDRRRRAVRPRSKRPRPWPPATSSPGCR